MEEQLLPRLGSVHVRAMIQLIDDVECADDDNHDDKCLPIVGVSWPTPMPWADLDQNLGWWME